MEIASRKKTRGILATVLIISLGLHLAGLFLFGLVRIAQEVFREEVAFEAPPIEQPPQEQPEYTVNLMQRNQESSPPPPNPIVVSDPQDVDVPALNIDVNIDSASAYGRGTGGFGTGTGAQPQIRQMAIDLTKFGYNAFVEGTLEGQLFDLKHDANGKKLVEYDKKERIEGEVGKYASRIIRKFADGSNWSVKDLARDFRSPDQKLYGSFFVIPHGPAVEAPKAFNAEKEIDAKAIMAVYSGTFTPPEEGRFRFVGRADDTLIVRANNRIVFDGSYTDGYSSWSQQEAEKGPENQGLFGMPGKELIYGDWMTWDPKRKIKLEVLVAETPGGNFCAYLLYQKEGGDLQVFSTKPLTSKEMRQIRDTHDDAKKFL